MSRLVQERFLKCVVERIVYPVVYCYIINPPAPRLDARHNRQCLNASSHPSWQPTKWLRILKFTGRRSGLWAWPGLSDGLGQASTAARDRTAIAASKRAAADGP